MCLKKKSGIEHHIKMTAKQKEAYEGCLKLHREGETATVSEVNEVTAKLTTDDLTLLSVDQYFHRK